MGIPWLQSEACLYLLRQKESCKSVEAENKLLMKKTTTAKNITELMHKTTRHLLGRKRPDEMYKANALHLFHVALHAKSCEYQMDIRKDLWLTKKKWNQLIKQYIDRERLSRFIEQSQLILDGRARREGASTNMLFKDPKRENTKHYWGGCLMGVTFQGELGKHPTITLYSRTCFMGYVGFLDAAIPALLVSKEILTGTSDTSPADVEFRWFITAMQIHSFKILPYVHSCPDLLRELKYWSRHRRALQNSPKSALWKNIVRYYCKMTYNYRKYGTDMLEQCKYGPWRRIQTRWLEAQGHLPQRGPESLPISELDFRSLK